MSRWLAVLPLDRAAGAGRAVLLLRPEPRPAGPAPGAGRQAVPDLTLPTWPRASRCACAQAAAEGPMVVNFFASWCAPCEIEHPVLMGLKGSGVRVVGVAYKDAPPNTQAFLTRLGDPFTRCWSTATAAPASSSASPACPRPMWSAATARSWPSTPARSPRPTPRGWRSSRVNPALRRRRQFGRVALTIVRPRVRDHRSAPTLPPPTPQRPQRQDSRQARPPSGRSSPRPWARTQAPGRRAARPPPPRLSAPAPSIRDGRSLRPRRPRRSCARARCSTSALSSRPGSQLSREINSNLFGNAVPPRRVLAVHGTAPCHGTGRQDL